MPLPNPVRCHNKNRAKSSPSSSKSKPRLPLDLQTRVLLAFFDNMHDQGGPHVDGKLFQLPPLSFVCKDWATLVRPEYAKWVPFDLRLKGMEEDGSKQPFDAGIIEQQLQNLRRARCSCCHSRGGLRISLDNPDLQALNSRDKVWKRALENILVEYRACPQLQLELADANSGYFAQDIFRRFTRTLLHLFISAYYKS